MDLGGKAKLNVIMEMGYRALVRHFHWKRMSSEDLKNWTKLNFKPVGWWGGWPCTLIIVKGWLVVKVGKKM